MLTSWLDIVVVFLVTAVGFLAVVSIGAACAEAWHRFQGSGLTLATVARAPLGAHALAGPVQVQAVRARTGKVGNVAAALIAFTCGCVVAGSIAAGRFNSVKSTLTQAALSAELQELEVVGLVQRLSDTADRLRREPSGSSARLLEIDALVATMRQKLSQIRMADCRAKIELAASSLVPFNDSKVHDRMLAKCRPG